MPINVLHIIQGRHFGGAEQVVFTLAKSFNHRQVAPEVVCLSDGLLREKLARANIPNHLISMRSKVDIGAPLLELVELVKHRRIDIVHTHSVRSNLLGRLSALLSRRRCITHLHSPIERDFADLRRGKLNEILDSMTRPIADRIITVSQSLRDEMLRRGFPPHKVVAIHNALDMAALYPPAGKTNGRESLREEFNIAGDAFLLVLIALLRPRKGVHIAVRAMRTIAEKFPEAHLTIVGDAHMSEDPDYGNHLKRLVQELDIESKVTFTGFRDDIPSILSQCDLMVLPSLFGEGLPMVVLESMAMGVPVVASRVEGIPEIIDDGVNGLLVAPGDPEDLVEKVSRALLNPSWLKSAGKNALQKILNEYDGSRQAQRIARIYREVLSN